MHACARAYSHRRRRKKLQPGCVGDGRIDPCKLDEDRVIVPRGARGHLGIRRLDHVPTHRSGVAILAPRDGGGGALRRSDTMTDGGG